MFLLRFAFKYFITISPDQYDELFENNTRSVYDVELQSLDEVDHTKNDNKTIW